MIDFKDYIEDVQDFPKEGILYRDIQPLLEDEEVFYDAIYAMGEFLDKEEVDYFVGIESRGFIFAAALAAINLKPFKMIRKEGKLPDRNHVLHAIEYDLEYGSAVIEIHSDAVKSGQKVLIHDDLLATGGSADAAAELIHKCGVQR